jgi:hypothetical protein
VEHRVEEVLHLRATEAEFAETLDIALYMGGSLAMKSVRYAFDVKEAVTRSAASGVLGEPRADAKESP